MNIFQKTQTNWVKKIEQMQQTLHDAEEESKRAKAQEEVLENHLVEKFECKSLDEAKELYSLLLTEKEQLINEIETETNSLYEKMKADGLIQ